MKIRSLCFVVAILLLGSINSIFANNPTVTVTKTNISSRAVLYTATFSTNISLADTAFIFNENGNWFSIDGTTAHEFDNEITIECYTSETTADSIHYNILYQTTSATSPTVTAGALPNSGWVTAIVDSTNFNGVAAGTSPSVSHFYKVRYAGQATKMRIIVAELQTGAYTAKDANQNVTLRIVIPRR